jgi:hypothetical protein
MNIARMGTNLVVSWPSVAGYTYQLSEAPDASGGRWAPVGEPVAGTGTTLQVSVSAENPFRCYRVRVLQ